MACHGLRDDPALSSSVRGGDPLAHAVREGLTWKGEGKMRHLLS